MAFHRLAWLSTWWHVLPTRHGKEESRGTLMAASVSLPEIWRDLCLLAWQACRGNFDGWMMGYASAVGRPWFSLPERTPVTDTIILCLGDGEAPLLEVQTRPPRQGRLLWVTARAASLHRCGRHGMLSYATAGRGQGSPFYGGLGRGCCPPP